ncbi:MAG: hypothetical protein MJZ72_09485 [Bacteroidales bacterium]|nr:hypothetical protein [Bacteroidales bacterium]
MSTKHPSQTLALLKERDNIAPFLKRSASVYDSAYFDFSLLSLTLELRAHGYDGHSAKFQLRGYDLIVKNPSNLYIRYSCGYLWIDSYGIRATTFNDAYSVIVSLVADILDAEYENDYSSIALERRRKEIVQAIEKTTMEASKHQNKKKINKTSI